VAQERPFGRWIIIVNLEAPMPHRFALLLAITSLAGCADATAPVSAPTAAATSRSASGSHENQEKNRVISGSCSAHIVSLVPLSPTLSREVVAGTCQLEHFGRATTYLRQVIDFTTLIGTSEELTYTFANGDVLRATSITKGTPVNETLFTIAGTYTFVSGGTGRFEHASGSADFTGTADFATHTASWVMRGRLSYDGNDREGGRE
jgi:hypothetical protein